MIRALYARMKQGKKTVSYPRESAVLPPLFRGYPRLLPQERCEGCGLCTSVCPTGAISCGESLSIDMGKCLFCPECAAVCPHGALSFTDDPCLAVNHREDLMITADGERKMARALEQQAFKLFGRSLKLRQVSSGGCNACEADINVLNTVVFDLGRFGVQFVASPRHADGILVTGPVTENMKAALLKTYEAVPPPKIVIASGACAISGGPFADSPNVHNGVDGIIPVDLYIPGCPPHPITTLDGLVRLLGRL